MNGKATAEQKRFQNWCRSLGCITGNDHGSIAFHHIKGARMNLKGVKNAGEWYVLPVCYYWHQDLSNDSAIHTNRKKFAQFWEATEKEFWLCLMEDYKNVFGKYPMSENEYQIIKERA